MLNLFKGTADTKELFLNHLYDDKNKLNFKIIDIFIYKLHQRLFETTGDDNHAKNV